MSDCLGLLYTTFPLWYQKCHEDLDSTKFYAMTYRWFRWRYVVEWLRRWSIERLVRASPIFVYKTFHRRTRWPISVARTWPSRTVALHINQVRIHGQHCELYSKVVSNWPASEIPSSLMMEVGLYPTEGNTCLTMCQSTDSTSASSTDLGCESYSEGEKRLWCGALK